MTLQTEALPAEAGPDTGAERRLGWLFALGGCILVLDQTVLEVRNMPSSSPVWNLLAMMVVVGILAIAMFGLILPMRILRMLWWTIPALYLLAQLLWAVGYLGEGPASTPPWSWTMEPAVVTMLILILSPVQAIVASLCISLLPALSSLLVWGTVSHALLRETVVQLPNVIYVTVFLGIYAHLTQLRREQAAAREQQQRQLRADATAAEQARIAMIVHDEVLSVLSAAMLTNGPPSTLLRQAAAGALRALDEAAEGLSHGVEGAPSTIDTGEAHSRIVGCLTAVDSAVPIQSRVLPGSLPPGVVHAAGLAGAEALRNSLRHAGIASRRTISVELEEGQIQLTVDDDGRGFDPRKTTYGLGISQSISQRMRDVGGAASVVSCPGRGTTVLVRWPR